MAHRRGRQRAVGPAGAPRRAAAVAAAGRADARRSSSPSSTSATSATRSPRTRRCEILRPRAAGPRGADRRAAAGDGYPAYTTTPGWLGYDDEKLVRLSPRGGRRRVHPDQAEGRRRPRRRPPPAARSPARRSGPDIRIADRRQPALGRRARRSRGSSALRAVRPVLDRGADHPRRRPRPRRHPRARWRPIQVATGEHVPEPGDVQAAAAGRRASTSCRSTPAGSAGVNENIAILLLAAKFGVPVCPHAGGVGLCEMVQHLAMFDYVAVSGTLGGPRDRVRRPPARALRRPGGDPRRPLRGTGRRRGGWRACSPSPCAAHAFPDGPEWQVGVHLSHTERGEPMKASTVARRRRGGRSSRRCGSDSSSDGGGRRDQQDARRQADDRRRLPALRHRLLELLHHVRPEVRAASCGVDAEDDQLAERHRQADRQHADADQPGRQGRS